MKRLFTRLVPLCLTLVLLASQSGHGQFLMDMVDTTTNIGKSMFSIYKKYDRVGITGYIQPQYQIAQEKGIKSFSGGDFPPQVSNRFMLRRGRLRFDYAHFTDDGLPLLQFVFQFDGTERGVFIRDFWGRAFEKKFELFSLTTGMFARPFGYEVNLGSADRESPERGRMSQTLMRVERDLGAMVSFEPRKKNHPLKYFKWDVGVFNGQGLTAPGEFDNHKDFISRFSLKPFHVANNATLSFGISYLNGGLAQNTQYVYTIVSGGKNFVVDSSLDNIGKIAPRKYYGADVQVKLKHGWGHTELRGEYWFGKQSSTADNSETPTTVLNEPFYIRRFNGAFIYFLQNIINTKHQVGVKYDWYDPNTDVSGADISNASNLTQADIRYSTFSFGYNYYINENLRLLLWYDIVKNETTQLNDFSDDLRDNVFTCRLQFRF